MALLDNLFSKKTARAKQAAPDTGDSRPEAPGQAHAAVERKVLRLERRELLYAVIREAMARVGVLSSTYKYKVLSLDSRGNEYLVMMDLPQDLASHLDQLAAIEDTVVESARQRHRITVVAVYWRIHDLGKSGSAVLRKPRPDAAAELMVSADDSLPLGSNLSGRFAPIRPEEVRAFKEGQRPETAVPVPKGFESTQFPETTFEETRIDERDERDDPHGRMPLSRTQYGDLI